MEAHLLQPLLMIGAPLIIFFLIGIPISFAFIFVMLIASIYLIGSPTGPYMSILSFYDSLAVFSYAPVPLFILMGNVLFLSGLGFKSLDVISNLLGKIPARLAIVANLGGALLGMLVGSTMASTALLGSTLLPEMLKRGYSKELSYGPILASGGLAMIIPPSTLAIIYGTSANVPIGRLLIAGILPGLFMTATYIGYILIKVKIDPSMAPSYEIAEIALSKKIKTIIIDLIPVCSIIFLVTGIFVFGIATPTEAAALGAVGTLAIAAIYKRLSFKILYESLSQTVVTSSMCLFIIGASVIFSQILGYSGISRNLVSFAVGLNISPVGILFAMIVVVIILGCVIESVPIIMIITPIFSPVISALGMNPLWVGVILLITIQIGLTTPPFGLSLFVLKSVAPKDTTFSDLYRAALPFICCNLLNIALIIVFPSIALWLPEVLFG